MIELRLAVDSTTASLVTGNADHVLIDPIKGVLSIAGRDLTSLFIESQTEASFENQTSSSIAAALASRHGLLSSATPTHTLVGRYFQNGHSRLAPTQHARATTEWDLLCWLAQIEDYDIWVSGQTLNFNPIQQNAPILDVTPSDCLTLEMGRSLDLAQGISVTVKSWNSLTQSAVVQSASSSGMNSAAPTRTVLRPNLSTTDAQNLANRLVSEISAHERTLQFTMAGDLTTSPRAVMTLSNTGTSFDGNYVICSVDRHISFNAGFTQIVEARSPPWTPS